MVDKSHWVIKTEQDPNHSHWYIERFRKMAADGADLAGEARMIDAMVPRNARILDAGCGPGRTGGYLATCGHTVVGVDVDPVLIAAAEADHPGPTWLVNDLAELDLPARGIDEGFDVIVSAGNVLTFCAASTRGEILRRLGLHLNEGGRIVTGFGAERGYGFDEFAEHVEAAGLVFDAQFSTWDLRPTSHDEGFLVSVMSRVA